MSCNQDSLREKCTCTFFCSRKGKYCECIEYHLSLNELPGYAFAKISKESEKTGNRSFNNFAKVILNKE